MPRNGSVRTAVPRLAAGCAGLALLAVPAAPAWAGTAQATTTDRPDTGRASAVVLRTDLDVSLLNKTVDVPLTLTLNEVRAPKSAEKTALTARLDGVDHGKPFSVLRADVASAKATVSGTRAEGRTELAHAKLNLPGLPLLSLIEVGAVSSRATCETGRKPVAEANLLGSVTVLGKKVTLSTSGTTQVTVPGVGEVRLDLAKRHTTSRTAAASALELAVSVDPLKLGVAKVTGRVTLAGATCETPAAKPGKPAEPEKPGGPDDGGDEAGKPERPEGKDGAGTGAEPQTERQTSQDDLAATGGGSQTPYLVSGAIALLGAGACAFALARRRRG
ncbi:hypothetical protein HUT18_04785 [Streptomyces sp. NA04227]|uniref:SCO1860 family LAETG-anchored protein n=1 Tax=Streptomyces sp. NA04227 TaxID=2742136 RepID=UPI0015907B65|nr:SCO1860 family LAETG-anchored protein [Streptomyces sp. NA04227]QKW05796.1 hypothetical protein HUT18_04785 [Streptomyces sp. NA04227]